MPFEQELLARAEALAPWISQAYRALHRRPELAHRERETNAYLRARLDEMRIPYFAPADNITVAMIEGDGDGPCVGLRCDTDALPVREETGLPFASEREGVMHACGHDAHMAIGLGAARLLSESRGQWRGRAKLIFQPAEEGECGADEVIRTGLADDVDVFFAIHVWSPFESGTLHAAPVKVSAAVDMFTVRVSGRGGHGATPEKCADAIVAASALVGALQTAVSRAVSPMEPAVVTIGSFHAGSVGNVIAQEAELKGTLRALDEDTRRRLEAQLKHIAQATAAAYGCEAAVEIARVSDVVCNDARAAAIARACALRLAPEDKVGGQSAMMLGDDFANYGRIAPGCYAQVGIADEAAGTCAAHHNGRFRVDERVLPLSAAWMASFVCACGEAWR